jgi:hypothetical protein
MVLVSIVYSASNISHSESGAGPQDGRIISGDCGHNGGCFNPDCRQREAAEVEPL